MKLKKHDDEYEDNYQELGWIAHQEGGNGDEASKELIANRYELNIIGSIEDKEASYSYDDWALIELKGKFYMLATSGCSCPSPSETWRIEKGPATLAEIKKHILHGDYDGYTMPVKQEQDFIDLIKTAEKVYKKR